MLIITLAFFLITGEVLLNDLLSPRHSVAPAHREIMADRMSDRTVVLGNEVSRLGQIDFRRQG
jgi:hypothetical protein